jgi:DNA-binding transcriptional MocR family regulator
MTLPDLQLIIRPGIIDFGWGHPRSDLLPAADLRRAADAALEHDGMAALAYGFEQGPGRLIEQLCGYLGRLDGVAPAPEQVFVTGGISHGLDLLCTLLTRPGEIVLVESPAYHLAQRIFRDHDLRLYPIPGDQQGACIDALEDALSRLQRSKQQAAFLYTIPTYCNPTGACLPPDRRAALMGLAERHNLLVLEDDVYRELWYDTSPPESLAQYGNPARVVRLGSFAKILAPGLRLGWLVADPLIVQRCVRSGVLDSGGGVNHFTAHIVAEYLRMGLLTDHLAGLRAAYRAQRDALVAALRRHLPASCRFTTPGGGFFLWVQLPEGMDSITLLSHAEAAGVSFLRGAIFHSDGAGQNYIRLAFSLLSLEEMEEGARRLASVMKG